jgi:hypothetical protein
MRSATASVGSRNRAPAPASAQVVPPATGTARSHSRNCRRVHSEWSQRSTAQSNRHAIPFPTYGCPDATREQRVARRPPLQVPGNVEIGAWARASAPARFPLASGWWDHPCLIWGVAVSALESDMPKATTLRTSAAGLLGGLKPPYGDRRHPPARLPQVVRHLEPEPHLGTRPKGFRQPNGHLD